MPKGLLFSFLKLFFNPMKTWVCFVEIKVSLSFAFGGFWSRSWTNANQSVLGEWILIVHRIDASSSMFSNAVLSIYFLLLWGLVLRDARPAHLHSTSTWLPLLRLTPREKNTDSFCQSVCASPLAAVLRLPTNCRTRITTQELKSAEIMTKPCLSLVDWFGWFFFCCCCYFVILFLKL